MVTYYARFLPNLSTITHPLSQWLHKNAKFKWSKECEDAFVKIKGELTSDKFLVPYDSNLPIRVECDASPYEVGAILSHIVNDQERPIAFVSRALTKTEQNYSQIGQGALSVVFAVNKFYAYLFIGRSFELVTDNDKAPTRIFNPSNIPPMTASRLVGYAMFLRDFDYKIRLQKGEENTNADFLLRAPMSNGSKGVEAAFAIEVDRIEAKVVKQISTPELTAKTIAEHTKSDAKIQPILKALIRTSKNDVDMSNIR